MALTRIGVPKPAPKVTESDSGGGLFGSVLGAIAGAAAVIATGGTAAAPLTAMGVMGGAGAGSSLGGIAGGVLKPGQKGSVEEMAAQGVPQTESALSRKFPQPVQAPETSQFVTDALRALREAPEEAKQLAVPPLMNGLMRMHGKVA